MDISDAINGGSSWPHLSALIADWQTSGRGRAGRTWVTPAGTSLTFSLVIRPTGVARDAYGWIPLVAGLAVARALRREGLDAALKWPNDVVVPDALFRHLPEWGASRKICGILCEAVGDAVIVGIGLNVSQSADELPVPHATSLALARTSNLDRTELFTSVIRELASALRHWEADAGAGDILDDVAEVCDTIGRDVIVDRPGASPLSGKAVGLAPDGGLILEIAPGWVETVLAGDVRLRAL